MLIPVLGIMAFVLFFLYDINSFLWKSKIPRTFFLIGSILLAAAAVTDLFRSWRLDAFRGPVDILLFLSGLLFLALLIYTLFFALPFQETYTEQSNSSVYDRGVYALCRHPGILWFFGMYLCWGLAALPQDLLRNGMLFSLLNLAYAWFQDCITFPKTFCDYTEYKKNVPFLIPTRTSTHAAVQTLLHTNDEEAVS